MKDILVEKVEIDGLVSFRFRNAKGVKLRKHSFGVSRDHLSPPAVKLRAAEDHCARYAINSGYNILRYWHPSHG